MIMNKFYRPLVILLSLSLLNCVTPPPDVPIFIDLGFCGHGIYTLSDKELEICGDEWQKLKGKSVLAPTDSWAKIKIYILEMCKQSNTCVDIQKKIEKLEDQ